MTLEVDRGIREEHSVITSSDHLRESEKQETHFFIANYSHAHCHSFQSVVRDDRLVPFAGIVQLPNLNQQLPLLALFACRSNLFC